MNKDFTFNEKLTFKLRGLYENAGYAPYRMSKFEEYDLYARNKDFLISDGVITFTDTNGKLMALKPDVTLSIIKNIKTYKGCTEKVYYNENVYRISKGTRSFKEIMQVGLECLGDIDAFAIAEVLTLAADSLMGISESCVLDISHLGIISGIIEGFEIPETAKAEILKCVGDKNVHELKAICSKYGEGDKGEALAEIIAIGGCPKEALAQLREKLGVFSGGAPLKELEKITSALPERVSKMLRIDLSVVSDLNYYNGIVFKGFIDGVPASVLSGGQYDKLMGRMHRDSGAIGFAIYLDMLERMDKSRKEFDADVLVLYDEAADLGELMAYAEALRAKGDRVQLQRSVPEDMKYREIITFGKGDK